MNWCPNWIDSPHHHAWLWEETRRLLEFGTACAIADHGAGWLDARGRLRAHLPAATWITCRMVHVYSLGHLLGIPGCRAVAQQVLTGLNGRLKDNEFGGWFNDATGDSTVGKQAYDHAFVVLAGSSATAAGLDGGPELLADALQVFASRFLDDDGLVVDSWNRDFTVMADYRGINSTMHTVEALLAAADVTGQTEWLERAARLARFAAASAAAVNWRMPEHFSSTWEFLPEYNTDRRDDQFRPYGATVGHGLEWSRLLLQTEAALAAAGLDITPGMDLTWEKAARSLYTRAVKDGWDPEGLPGFVYTTDWEGQPITTDRLHWVVAEAIGAAASLRKRTGENDYAHDYATWWEFAETHLIDRTNGSWHHELDPKNQPAARVWPGKPDLYHAVQATLIPTQPLTPCLASALAR